MLHDAYPTEFVISTQQCVKVSDLQVLRPHPSKETPDTPFLNKVRREEANIYQPKRDTEKCNKRKTHIDTDLKEKDTPVVSVT